MKKLNDVECKFVFIHQQQEILSNQNTKLKFQIETIHKGLLETLAGKQNSLKGKF